MTLDICVTSVLSNISSLITLWHTKLFKFFFTSFDLLITRTRTQTRTPKHTHIYTSESNDVYVWIFIFVLVYFQTFASLHPPCRAGSTDLTGSLLPSVFIVHLSREVFQATSCIDIVWLYIGYYWSSCLCSSMWRVPWSILLMSSSLLL